MANQEHLDILNQGVVVWNQWREEHSDIQPDLRGASFHFADLRGVNLDRADLRDSHLTGTSLNYAHLSEADLGALISWQQTFTEPISRLLTLVALIYTVPFSALPILVVLTCMTQNLAVLTS